LGEKSGAIALVLPGLMAGRLAVRMAGRPADEVVLNLKFFKIIYQMNIQVFAMFNKGTVLL